MYHFNYKQFRLNFLPSTDTDVYLHNSIIKITKSYKSTKNNISFNSLC